MWRYVFLSVFPVSLSSSSLCHSCSLLVFIFSLSLLCNMISFPMSLSHLLSYFPFFSIPLYVSPPYVALFLLKKTPCLAHVEIVCWKNHWVENPSTSYRIGKPTTWKIPPNKQNVGSPEIPLQIPPWIPQKYENRIFGAFFWYFRGIFRSLGGLGEFGCRAGVFGLFWGLWGFLLCS